MSRPAPLLRDCDFARAFAPCARLQQVLLGDMGAGKSSLVLRFVKGQFFDYQACLASAARLSWASCVDAGATEGLSLPWCHVRAGVDHRGSLPHSDRLSGGVDREVRDLVRFGSSNESHLEALLTRRVPSQGYRGSREVPQPRADVLPRCGPTSRARLGLVRGGWPLTPAPSLLQAPLLRSSSTTSRTATRSPAQRAGRVPAPRGALEAAREMRRTNFGRSRPERVGPSPTHAPRCGSCSGRGAPRS